jgi:hypothetical protein
MKHLYLVLAAAGLALGPTACGSDQEPAAAPSTAPSSTAATEPTTAPVDEPTEPTSAPLDGHHSLTAGMVVGAFKDAGLPVRNPRDNTAQNCPDLGCTQLISTDDVSIYTWADPVAQSAFAKSYGEGAHSSGNVVLSYLAARTPEKTRAKYERVLAPLK